MQSPSVSITCALFSRRATRIARHSRELVDHHQQSQAATVVGLRIHEVLALHMIAMQRTQSDTIPSFNHVEGGMARTRSPKKSLDQEPIPSVLSVNKDDPENRVSGRLFYILTEHDDARFVAGRRISSSSVHSSTMTTRC